ncbi:bacteriohemerythrin [Dongia sp.]|uniref:bacteriohemerythrin n=1 Tax=Dongia sp. TaxID=1977262 RepID=UPI0037516635
MADEIVLPITWMDVLETGVPELDAEHRALIDQCNILISLMQGSGPWARVVAAARELALSCHAHFRTEEALLDQYDFPRLDRHKAQHRELERRFNELVGVLSGTDGSSDEHRAAALTVRGTLIDILFRHDLDYKSHLQNAAGR